MKLDDIRAAVESKYAAFKLEFADGSAVNMLNAIRLDASKRAKLTGLTDKLKAEGADQVKLLEEALAAVAETPAHAKRVIDECGHDLAMLMEIFTEYAKATQVGEASASHE